MIGLIGGAVPMVQAVGAPVVVAVDTSNCTFHRSAVALAFIDFFISSAHALGRKPCTYCSFYRMV